MASMAWGVAKGNEWCGAGEEPPRVEDGEGVAAVGNMRAVPASHKRRAFRLRARGLGWPRATRPAHAVSPAPRAPMRRLLLLLAVLLPLAHPSRGAAQAADSAYLRPGDLVRLAVFRQPDFSGDFPVSPEGTLQHPLLSGVRVVGVSRASIRERLREALAVYVRDPSFVFDFLYRVSITGEVRLPNLLNLSPETTLGQAVAAAGGVTEFGRLDRVRLVRDGHEMVVNL